MNYRRDSFVRRFRSAKLSLGAQDIQGLVSFKYRDDPVAPSEYLHFIDDYLRQNLRLDVARVDGDFGGQAWLVTDKAQNKAMLVEHETGLEILGAIGSVASLIALLPLISLGWAKLRRRFLRPHFDRPNGEGVEIRHFSQNNILIEQEAPSVEVYVLNATLQDYALLKQRVVKLEAEIESLKEPGPPGGKRQKAQSRRKKSKGK